MKNLQLATMILAFGLFLMSSCSKDAEASLPGTWNTDDGGTITFNEDGTGITMDSEFFLWDCGTITTNGNAEYLGPVEEFTWMITADGENLFMEFDDQTSFSIPCGGTMEFPVKVKNKKSATVGVNALGFGVQVELTK